MVIRRIGVQSRTGDITQVELFSGKSELALRKLVMLVAAMDDLFKNLSGEWNVIGGPSVDAPEVLQKGIIEDVFEKIPGFGKVIPGFHERKGGMEKFFRNFSKHVGKLVRAEEILVGPQ